MSGIISPRHGLSKDELEAHNFRQRRENEMCEMLDAAHFDLFYLLARLGVDTSTCDALQKIRSVEYMIRTGK